MDCDVYESTLMFQGNMSAKGARTSQKVTLLDDMTMLVTQVIFDIVLRILLSLLGIVSNIINVVVFTRQGIFSDGSNLNLFCLALSDLGVVITGLFYGIGFSIIIADIPDLQWDPFAVTYITTGWPNSIFTMSTRLLTAYITFERCMCVMLPFRVKILFAPRRSLVYIILLFACAVITHVPVYVTDRLDFETQKETNTSKLVLIYSSDREKIFDVVAYLNYFALTFATVIIVFICTVITSSHIKTSKEWRQKVAKTDSVKPATHQINTSSSIPLNTKTTGNNDANDTSKDKSNPSIDKETRLVKIITLVSIIFLICCIPELAYIVANEIDKRISVSGQYQRLSHLLFSIVSLTSAFNSSVNIFVYYTMSSRYRKELRNWCQMSYRDGI